ncbi:MAG: lipocalin-like domain-containing protein [Phycisphaerae bacterium]
MNSRTPDQNEMHGVWILESVTTPLPDGGEQHPFGERPTGTIIYLAGGTMAVHIAGSDEAAGKLRAYSGRWRIAGDCVVHDVEESLEPELRGVRLERRALFDPATGMLTYTTIEAQGPGNPVVVWRKVL